MWLISSECLTYNQTGLSCLPNYDTHSLLESVVIIIIMNTIRTHMYLFITDVEQEWYRAPPLHEGHVPESIRGDTEAAWRRAPSSPNPRTCAVRWPHTTTFLKWYLVTKDCRHGSFSKVVVVLGRCSALVPLDLWSYFLLISSRFKSFFLINGSFWSY